MNKKIQKTKKYKAFVKFELRKIGVFKLNGHGINNTSIKNLEIAYIEIIKSDPLKDYRTRLKIKRRLQKEKKINDLRNKEYREGYVYVIGNKEHNICKIGFSEEVDKRLRSIQTGCPFNIYIIAQFKGSMATEKRLHKKYNKYRIRNNGEWFYYKGDLKKSIENVIN